MVREMSISLGRCWRRVPKQLSYDFEAEPARNEMRRIRVSIVVPSVVRNTRLAHNCAPEFLHLSQRLTRFVPGEQKGRARIARLDNGRG